MNMAREVSPLILQRQLAFMPQPPHKASRALNHVRGPGGRGNITALVTTWLGSDTHYAIGCLRKGRAALFHHPLAPKDWLYDGFLNQEEELVPTTPKVDATTRAQQLWRRKMHTDTLCTLCSKAHPQFMHEDPYHVLVECQHPDVVTERAKMLSNLPTFLESAAQLALRSTVPIEYGNRDELLTLKADQQAASIHNLAKQTDWHGADGAYVLFHMLLVATWSPTVCSESDHPLSHAIGRIWSSVNEPAHKLRNLANFWTRWAGTNAISMHEAWAKATPL